MKMLKSKTLWVTILGNILIMCLDLPASEKAEHLAWLDSVYVGFQKICDAWTNGKTSASQVK